MMKQGRQMFIGMS